MKMQVWVSTRAYKTELLASIITLYRQRFSQTAERFTVLPKNSQGPLVSDADHLQCFITSSIIISNPNPNTATASLRKVL